MADLVWIVDDDESMATIMEKTLARQGLDTRVFHDPNALLDAVKETNPDLIVSDIRMPGMTGFELTSRINQINPDIPIIMVTAFGDLDTAVDAYKHGVFEYLTKPFDLNDLNSIVAKALTENSGTDPEEDETKPGLLGKSPAMQELFRVIGRLANARTHVLVLGESGTGKGLVAQALHENGERSDQPLVWVDVSANSAEQLERMLFGVESPTSDDPSEQALIESGRLELANGGTLVLDEVADMPLAVQSRLLTLLSKGHFYRIGGKSEVLVDIRVIATTSQDLPALCANGRFRTDFYHRLNMSSITVPSLRDRDRDLVFLIDTFLALAASKHKVEVKTCHQRVLRLLQDYAWPGNVRELKHLMERFTLMAPGPQVMVSDMPHDLKGEINSDLESGWLALVEKDARHRMEAGEKEIAGKLTHEFEQVLITAALDFTKGHKINAAEILGWGRNTITRKMSAETKSQRRT